MTDSSRGYQQFFAELKRLHVFRVAAIYGAVAFGVLQVAEPLGIALGLSDSFLSLVVGLLLLGFPVALVLAWAFEVTPEGVQKAEPAAPGEIESIMAQPASKRWPAGLLALAGAALLFGGWWMGRQTAPATGDLAEANLISGLKLVDLADDARPSIAVLPFVNMSADEEQEYFSDGMTEEILNVLAKIGDLRVAARTSTFALRDRELTASQWGDTLNVRYFVEGSVRRAGDELRITAQLIDTSDGSHLWTDSYTRPIANVFDIQIEIAEAIAEALAVPLGLDDSALVTPTADLEAYDLYLAGRQQMRARGEHVAEAVKLFEAAIARDSSWAPAWAGLAESSSLLPYYSPGVDSTFWRNSLAAAERAALRALELDEGNASALVALGSVYRDQWDWQRAEEMYIRALTQDPENVEAHQQYAELLTYTGRMDEGYTAAQRALALDQSPIRLNIAGGLARYNGRFAEALALFEKAIRADPEGTFAFSIRGNQQTAYREMGNWATYREALLSMLADVHETTGHPGPEELAREVRSAWPDNAPLTPEVAEWFADEMPSIGAEMLMALGERDRALEALELHLDSPGHSFGARTFLWRLAFDALRDDPRFQAVMAANGLQGLRPKRLPPDEESTP